MFSTLPISYFILILIFAFADFLLPFIQYISTKKASMQTISRSKGRPKGKSSCGNCTGCKKKRKCLNKFKLNLNSDALIASQVASPSHIREHTTKPSLGKKLRSNFNINKVNNPSGHNQWSKLDNKENIDPIKCGKKAKRMH